MSKGGTTHLFSTILSSYLWSDTVSLKFLSCLEGLLFSSAQDIIHLHQP